jgi:DNA-binding phage protein
MGQLGRDIGLTRESVCKTVALGGNQSYAIVAKVAMSLGYRLTLAPVCEVLGKSQDLNP